TGQPAHVDDADLADTDGQWSIGADGDMAARLIYDSRNTHWTLASRQAQKVVAEGDAGFGPVVALGAGRTPGTVAVLTHGDGGYDGLYEVPLAGGAWQPVTSGREVQRAWSDPDSGRLIGYTWFDDSWRDVLFD